MKMTDLFWRTMLWLGFGKLLEWWQKLKLKRLQAKLLRQCSGPQGHLALRRVAFPVGEKLGEAVIERKLVCMHCQTVTHKTWKGTMPRAMRKNLAMRPRPIVYPEWPMVPVRVPSPGQFTPPEN
jgi:hypothetical protein